MERLRLSTGILVTDTKSIGGVMYKAELHLSDEWERIFCFLDAHARMRVLRARFRSGVNATEWSQGRRVEVRLGWWPGACGFGGWQYQSFVLYLIADGIPLSINIVTLKAAPDYKDMYAVFQVVKRYAIATEKDKEAILHMRLDPEGWRRFVVRRVAEASEV